MRKAEKELNRGEVRNIKKDYRARRTTPMKLRSQGYINEEESKGLDYPRIRNAPRPNELSEKNKTYGNLETVPALHELEFDTSTTFANDN